MSTARISACLSAVRYFLFSKFSGRVHSPNFLACLQRVISLQSSPPKANRAKNASEALYLVDSAGTHCLSAVREISILEFCGSVHSPNFLVSSYHLLTSHRSEVNSSCLRQIKRKVPAKHGTYMYGTSFRGKCPRSTSVLTQWSNIQWNDSEAASVTAAHCNAKQLCAIIREERAEELSRAGMENNAARKLHAMAVLKSALTKQWENGRDASISRLVEGIWTILCTILEHYWQFCEQYCVQFCF